MQDSELLREISEKITALDTKVSAIMGTQSDHEKRIRFLERGAFYVMGISAVLIVLFTFVKDFLTK